MNIWSNLFGDRRARTQWDGSLIWLRLRYETADKPTHCLNLLSRPPACGRLALYYLPKKPICKLYLGLPEGYVRLLQQMAADFHLSLQPVPDTFSPPALSRLTAVSDLSWDEPFLAHLVDGNIFVTPNREQKKGCYWPEPETRTQAPSWHLPDPPPSGLTIHPAWPKQPPAAHLVSQGSDTHPWPLGQTNNGIALGVPGRVNIYGRRDSVANWLVQQVAQIIATSPANLVVIDGAGDLVPRLKRKTAVTRLLGDQLTYIDIDGASLTSGFNPLAVVPGETEQAQVQRWQHWFGGMNVQPHALRLLPRAYQDGVGDIPGLRKWLKQIERRGQHTAVASLNLALTRLTSHRLMREWLEWPTNHFETLPQGILLFACPNTSWDKQQLLRAALLGALSQKDIYLVLHGLGNLWEHFHNSLNHLPTSIVVSNGPILPDTTIILVQTQPSHIPILASQFLGNDPQMTENLQLLQSKEGLVIHEKNFFFVRWLTERHLHTADFT